MGNYGRVSMKSLSNRLNSHKLLTTDDIYFEVWTGVKFRIDGGYIVEILNISDDYIKYEYEGSTRTTPITSRWTRIIGYVE